MFKVTARSVTQQQACACWAESLAQTFSLHYVVHLASSSHLHLGSTEQVGFCEVAFWNFGAIFSWHGAVVQI